MINRYMKVRFMWYALAIAVIAFGCKSDAETKGIYIFTYSFDFRDSDQGWKGAFSDYPTGPDSSAYELKSAYTRQPNGDNALLLSAKKHKPDLFMFVKKKLTGLSPDADYTVTFNVEFAYSAIAGSDSTDAGDAVFMKAGAVGFEPKRVLEGKQYTVNIDKGDQNENGSEMVFIGNASQPSFENEYGYSKATRTNSSSNENPLLVKTNADGELWLVVGSESAFEGRTILYYTKVDIVLSVPK